MKFYKSVSIYAVSIFIGKGISFLLLPFFTKYLSQSEYGLLTIFSNSIYFLTPIMAMGIAELFIVEYPSLSKQELPGFISTSLVFPICIFIVALLGILLFNDFIFQKTGLQKSLQILIICLSFFTYFIEYGLNLFRNQNKPIANSILSISKVLVELILAIYFIKYLQLGANGRIYSTSIAIFVIAAFVILYFTYKNLIKFELNTYWFKQILTRGLPIIPMYLMIFVLGNADNYMINFYRGKNIIGLYGLSWQYAMILSLITTSFFMPFYPYLFKNAKEKNYSKIVKASFAFVGLMVISAVLLIVISPFAFKMFISPKFFPALQYIPWLIFGQFFLSIALLLGSIIYYKKKTYLFYYIAPICIAATIVINYLLLNRVKVINIGLLSFSTYLFYLSIIVAFLNKDIFFIFKKIVNQG